MRRLLVLFSIVACALSSPQRNYYAEQNDRPSPGQLQAYVKFSPSDIRHLKTRGYALPLATSSPSQIPSGFRSTLAPDNSIASTHQRRPVFEEENYPTQNSLQVQGRPQQQQQQQQQQQVYRRPASPSPQYRQQLEQEAKELEEEKEEEPDRLTLLLPNSKFDCSGKVTGYYADEGLNCEVFHYCQDNAKHSWVCPDGFTFHQVHLICMPPSHDNICAKSSQFHFVNDYLYKAINTEEHEQQPNISLRYSDRYYPASYYPSEEEDEQQQQQQQHVPRKQPLQVGFHQKQQQQQQQQQLTTRSRQQAHFQPTLRPETTLYRGQQQHGQVFHSPEEVNISLQQRRPYILAQRSFQHQGRDEEIDYEK